MLNLSLTPYSQSRSAPTLGQHNEEVYCGQMGTSKEDLAQMQKLGII